MEGGSILVDRIYAIPVSNSNLYDIEIIATMRLLKSAKRRVQSEKSYQRHVSEMKQTLKTPTTSRHK